MFSAEEGDRGGERGRQKDRERGERKRGRERGRHMFHNVYISCSKQNSCVQHFPGLLDRLWIFSICQTDQIHHHLPQLVSVMVVTKHKRVLGDHVCAVVDHVLRVLWVRVVMTHLYGLGGEICTVAAFCFGWERCFFVPGGSGFFA